MKIKFITYQGLDNLKSIINSSYALFGKDTPDELLKKIGTNVLVDTGIECQPFNLIKSNNPDDDFENVKCVYTSLKDVLTESSASDERVWVGLAMNNEFWEYINKRWKKGGWKPSTIKDRMFFAQHYHTRSALCRLYWIGKRTYDQSNKEDPWHYTRFVCSNQRYIEDMLGRNMANNLKLIKVCVDACERYESENEGKAVNSNQMRDLQKYMSILGATYVLDTVNNDILTEKIYKKACSLNE